jgi:hypothetical protein
LIIQAIDENVNRADAHILLARIYEKKNMMDDAMN